MWTLITSIGLKFWKQISAGVLASFIALRYIYLKKQNRRLKSYAKKRIVIDHIESEHQQIKEEEKEAKKRLHESKNVQDLNKEWNK